MDSSVENRRPQIRQRRVRRTRPRKSHVETTQVMVLLQCGQFMTAPSPRPFAASNRPALASFHFSGPPP